MTPICKNCRWYYRHPMSPAASCQHPDAATIDRIHGVVTPVLIDLMGTRGKWADEVIDDCDREGRFEPIKPWWKFW